MTQIVESSVKRLALVGLIFLFVLSVATPFIPTVKAIGTYNYYLMGPLDEVTADYLTGNMTVTPHLWAEGVGVETAVSVNGSALYNLTTAYPVRYFAFDYNGSGVNQHREYWMDTGDLTNATYRGWFSSDILTSYTISFMDQVGILQTYPYVSVRAYILGVTGVIEKRPVDKQNIISVNLVQGSRYSIAYGDGVTSNTYGDITTTSITGIQLILRGVDFPKETLLLYQYVHAYAVRDFLNPVGAITVSFEDTTNTTTSVTITIVDTATSTTAYTATYVSNQLFSDTWSNAVNATNYEVTITIIHSTYGTFDYKQYLKGEYTKASEPFSLDFLGSGFPVATAVIIPALLIIFVAGCFSELTSEAAGVLTVIVAIILTALGWINIGQGAIISALALAVMAGIVTAKKRMQYQ